MTTFIVEDGTGVTGATSYVDVLTSDDYLGASWAADNSTKENALIEGSEYADARWGQSLRSRPLVSEQGLEIPRSSLYDRYGRQQEGVPKDWAKAVMLYAQQSLTNNLYPKQQTTAKDVVKKKTVVGPVTTEVQYSENGATGSSWVSFTLADDLAKQFTVAAYSNGGVIR